MNGILKRTLRGERGRFAPGGPSIRPSFDQLRTNGLMVEPKAAVTRFNIPFALSASKGERCFAHLGERARFASGGPSIRPSFDQLRTNGLTVEPKVVVARFNIPFALSLSKGERDVESHPIGECRTATHASTLLSMNDYSARPQG